MPERWALSPSAPRSRPMVGGHDHEVSFAVTARFAAICTASLQSVVVVATFEAATPGSGRAHIAPSSTPMNCVMFITLGRAGCRTPKASLAAQSQPGIYDRTDADSYGSGLCLGWVKISN